MTQPFTYSSHSAQETGEIADPASQPLATRRGAAPLPAGLPRLPPPADEPAWAQQQPQPEQEALLYAAVESPSAAAVAVVEAAADGAHGLLAWPSAAGSAARGAVRWLRRHPVQLAVAAGVAGAVGAVAYLAVTNARLRGEAAGLLAALQARGEGGGGGGGGGSGGTPEAAQAAAVEAARWEAARLGAQVAALEAEVSVLQSQAEGLQADRAWLGAKVEALARLGSRLATGLQKWSGLASTLTAASFGVGGGDLNKSLWAAEAFLHEAEQLAPPARKP
ncbi:hypothetical protein HYH03_010559 [Edaphochlamys debaryana]|uniref:Uncharacterized protein n=1 Tax=Edaphochlamys debaryana TaxID=47281 RepID=A0A835XWG7_9CHLO|nr:hypothetical protein HYH03_010559 [Edaphochlamys debaryana]|eukprot:KAG2491115.1 hypothetical protein HYH03_010559 [Edaphochlamys debaryana]